MPTKRNWTPPGIYKKKKKKQPPAALHPMFSDLASGETNSEVFPTTPFRALDLCSSWVSHYPSPAPERLAATGMNAEELQRNAQATDWTVQERMGLEANGLLKKDNHPAWGLFFFLGGGVIGLIPLSKERHVWPFLLGGGGVIGLIPFGPAKVYIFQTT